MAITRKSRYFISRELISMFPDTKSRETLRFEGNKIHCFPRDQSLSDLLYSKTKVFKQRYNLTPAHSGGRQFPIPFLSGVCQTYMWRAAWV